MNILAFNGNFNNVGSRKCYRGEFKELEVEGSKELEILCPVSKLTGFPMSMQEAIQYISDKDSRLAEVLYQELPVIKSDDRISDDDKLRLLVSRLDSGSFAEDDKVAEIIGHIAKEFFPSVDVEKVVEANKEKITFEASDNQPSDV